MLVTSQLMIAFPASAETYPDERPQVTVSVYNDAGVPTTVLAQAEQKAAKIFGRAGLRVAWRECFTSRVGPDAPVRAGGRSSPGLDQENSSEVGHESSPTSNPVGLRPTGRVGAAATPWSDLECAPLEWPTHLALRVVARSPLATSEVFGVAFLSADGEGCYSDVFYGQVMDLQSKWNNPLADTLGSVMAHEIGHLLLGLNSHSGMGIMRARWQSEELHRISRGGLGFTNEQAERMSKTLNRARPRVELAARSSY